MTSRLTALPAASLTPESGLRFEARQLSSRRSGDAAEGDGRESRARGRRGARSRASRRSAQAQAGLGGETQAAAPIKVGIVYSRTGLLAAYGAQYIQGLRYGLAYATKGTRRVNGRKIELTLADDGTDPTKAVAAGKDLIGKGYKILAGSVSSGVALQMAPLADAEQGALHLRPGGTTPSPAINRYTFRSGRQTYQDVLDRGDRTSARRRQERRRLRAGLGLRRRQLLGRQVGRSRISAGTASRGSSCRSRRRTSRRSRSR